MLKSIQKIKDIFDRIKYKSDKKFKKAYDILYKNKAGICKTSDFGRDVIGYKKVLSYSVIGEKTAYIATVIIPNSVGVYIIKPLRFPEYPNKASDKYRTNAYFIKEISYKSLSSDERNPKAKCTGFIMQDYYYQEGELHTELKLDFNLENECGRGLYFYINYYDAVDYYKKLK